jgi:hypothetical protein
MRIKVTLALLLCAFSSLFAQTATVNGKVLHKSNNSPIPYATLVIKMGDKIISG